MTSLLVRNYFFFIAAAAAFSFAAACSAASASATASFQSLAHFMSTTPNPQERWDTQKTMTISATSFRGCNRFSPSLIYIEKYLFNMQIFL